MDRSRGFPIIMGYRDEAILMRFWQSISKPLDRSAINLPNGKLELKINIRANLKEYHEIVKTRLYKGEMLETASALSHTLRQVVAKYKIDELVSILEGTNENVCVFYTYDIERELILKAVAKLGKTIYEQSGHKSDIPNKKDLLQN